MENKLIVRDFDEPIDDIYHFELKFQDFLISISDKGKPICTGYIVSWYSVVTVAHCMEKYETEDNYDGLIARHINEHNKILTSRSHPNYRTKHRKFYDISVVTVSFHQIF